MQLVRVRQLRFVAVLAVTLVLGSPSGQARERKLRVELTQDEAELRLRASPRVSFAPAEVLFVGEIRGGPDDNEELYCAGVEWDWNDDTISASTPDCDPFECSNRCGMVLGRRWEHCGTAGHSASQFCVELRSFLSVFHLWWLASRLFFKQNSYF